MRSRVQPRECVGELVDLLAVVDDAVDDLAGVEPRRLALGLVHGALGLGDEQLLDRHLAHVGRVEQVEGALARFVRALTSRSRARGTRPSGCRP